MQGAGVHFPGMLSSDVSFEALSAMKPLDAWTAVPSLGKIQHDYCFFMVARKEEGSMNLSHRLIAFFFSFLHNLFVTL